MALRPLVQLLFDEVYDWFDFALGDPLEIRDVAENEKLFTKRYFAKVFDKQSIWQEHISQHALAFQISCAVLQKLSINLFV
jgi:hypothetical protein